MLREASTAVLHQLLPACRHALSVPACAAAAGVARALSALPETSSVQTPRMPPCDYTPRPYTGPSAADVLAMRKAHLSPCRCLGERNLCERSAH